MQRLLGVSAATFKSDVARGQDPMCLHPSLLACPFGLQDMPRFARLQTMALVAENVLQGQMHTTGRT